MFKGTIRESGGSGWNAHCNYITLQVRQTLQSQSSWGWIPDDSLMEGTPNVILNTLHAEPLQVAWIGNGSDVLALTDTNSLCVTLLP